WGRSGSTILDRVLGQVPGLVSLGELRSLWDEEQVADRCCSCGELVASCPFWGGLVADVLADSGLDRPSDVARLREAGARTRHVALPGLGGRRAPGLGGEPADAAAARYLAVVLSTDRHALARSGGDMVIDSSKHPAEAFLLHSSPEVELTLVHLVRDPRASAYSWGRATAGGPGGAESLPRYGPVFSSLRWSGWNLLTEMLGRRRGLRYVAVRYEDLMAEPRRQIRAVLERAGVEADLLRFVGDREIELRETHTALGNPSRFSSGIVTLSPDTAWATSMGARDKLLATVPALPLMARYGYPLRAHAAAAPGGSPLVFKPGRR
ncbi:MAG: hypothetical protein ACRDYD_03130, partial [Acidimicrobiales bacterium]